MALRKWVHFTIAGRKRTQSQIFPNITETFWSIKSNALRTVWVNLLLILYSTFIFCMMVQIINPYTIWIFKWYDRGRFENCRWRKLISTPFFNSDRDQLGVIVNHFEESPAHGIHQLMMYNGCSDVCNYIFKKPPGLVKKRNLSPINLWPKCLKNSQTCCFRSSAPIYVVRT